MLWLLQQVNHGDMKIKKKQWIVVSADFLPFYKPLNKCKREWGGGVACHPNCVHFSHTGTKLWSQIPSCIIYIANLTLDLCIFKTVLFCWVFLLQILPFFLHSFLTFLQLLPWIFSKCLHWHRFLHFLKHVSLLIHSASHQLSIPVCICIPYTCCPHTALSPRGAC